MIRGYLRCKCRDCGHKFMGADVELMCTADSMPIKCSKCGSTNTSGYPLELYLLKEWITSPFKRK